MTASACVDRYFYGRWELVPLNFFRFNVLEGGSAAYGSHPWHWYISQGFPAIGTIFIPLAAMGCGVLGGNGIGNVRSAATAAGGGDDDDDERVVANGEMRRKKQKKGHIRWEPAQVVFWCVLGYSVPAHKEFRFVLPALPAVLAAAGAAIASLSPSSNNEHRMIHYDGQSISSVATTSTFRRDVIVAAVILTQVPAAAYLSLWHQSGTIALMPKIVAAAAAGEIHGGGVYIVTPCHQTPFYSHVHRRDVRLRFLECPPTSDPAVLDESEKFERNPGEYLVNAYGRGWADAKTGSLMSARAWSAALGRREVETARATAAYVPSHVVMFNGGVVGGGGRGVTCTSSMFTYIIIFASHTHSLFCQKKKNADH